MVINLPKLKKVTVGRTKKKIFLLTDDILSPSGVGTMAKELVFGTCNVFDWVQLAAALNHPEHGKFVDLSEAVEKETGYTDLYVKQYKHNGYFTPEAFYQIVHREKPDAIMLFTDPRHFMPFWPHEHTIRTELKIPIIYWSIWDNLPIPHWNEPYYRSCDMLLAINKQTHIIHNVVLGNKTTDLDLDEVPDGVQPITSYLPHGINPKVFYPIENDVNFDSFAKEFKEKHKVDFVVFWNSRNIRRKQPGDIILAFKLFCDTLDPEDAQKCCLLMKTHIQDPNGTDLMAVKDMICPDYKVIFVEEVLHPQIMNYFYNLADVTVNFSSAEGFGLGIAESIMAGTMVTAPVTGGLQDQMGFSFTPSPKVPTNHRGLTGKCGEWVLPIFPRARQLQGSIPTPYIFDDVCDAEDLATNLKTIYRFGKEERNKRGLAGREFMLENFSSEKMCNDFVTKVEILLSTWKPKQKYTIEQIKPANKFKTDGIVI